MSPVELILSRLDRVQRSGKGYRARCPACDGRSAKVSIAESQDGRALLHCFGGCDAASVLQAVGLTLADLYAAPIRDDATDSPDARRIRRQAVREVQWGAALEMLDIEVAVIDQAAHELASGCALSKDDLARVALARRRISDARAVLREPKPWRPTNVRKLH